MSDNWYLVAGAGKSGTTGLFYSICEAVPDAARSFERKGVPHILAQHENAGKLVAKVLISPDKFYHPSRRAGLERFGRRVAIIRDPRDVVVSRCMWRVQDMKFMLDERKFAEYRRLLRRKEENPRSVSIRSIAAFQNDLEGEDIAADKRDGIVTKFADCVMEVLDQEKDKFFLHRYEDYVTGNNASLIDYLGVSISNAAKIDNSRHARVARSKGRDQWRSWFTEEDVDWCRPIFSVFISRFGYADDWALAEEPAISPPDCSEYAERLRRNFDAR